MQSEHCFVCCRQDLIVVKRDGAKKKEQKTMKRKLKKSPLPLYVSPPLRTITFHAPVIDREDGFPEPIREEMP